MRKSGDEHVCLIPKNRLIVATLGVATIGIRQPTVVEQRQFVAGVERLNWIVDVNMDTKLIYGEESWGSYGAFKSELRVGTSKEVDFETDSIRSAVYKANALIKAAVMGEMIKNDPKAMKRAANEKKELLSLFPVPGTINFKEIPNGYCSDWCCKHLPWFTAFTNIGPITIGWRKRVISIDWIETSQTKTAHELFPNEDVTKEGKLIHAWGYDKAKEYIKVILGS